MKRISLLAVTVLFCSLILSCAAADLALKIIGYGATGINATESVGKESDKNASKLMWDPGKKKYYRIYYNEKGEGIKVYE